MFTLSVRSIDVRGTRQRTDFFSAGHTRIKDLIGHGEGVGNSDVQDFKAEVTDSGHWTFNARSGKHDDLVLALAIALWRSYGGDGQGEAD